jgi:hypothetical protein
MERVGQERRAEHIADLGARHAGLDLGGLLLGDDVALDDLDLVRRQAREETVGRLQRPGSRQHSAARQRGDNGKRTHDDETGTPAAGANLDMIR